MKRIALLCLLTIASMSYAQDKLAQTTIQGVLAGNQAQVVQLAEAFSEEHYGWRPAEGVSSVGEALLHVATANYFLTSKMGFPPPEDVDIMALGKIEGKENIINALKKSNAFVLDKVTQVPVEELGDEVDFGFMKMNKMGGLLALMEHNGEHKGQLIAYARSNGLVPPWSN